MSPNQPHRCEVVKMMVHLQAQRLDLGCALMSCALDRARELGKMLVTLDTRTDDIAEPLYFPSFPDCGNHP
ncbi:GNAT family N-acetyltransferase [Pseudochelatococcus sp. G4_1912]|uniref:GNAT family N-acetyltransferase n=1 Tax=Pseudochelatococcus sp. G4_1912 TaxID=3114288 RepID=UPI0039C62563